MAGSFLQTAAGATPRKLATSADMLAIDRQDLTAFLSGGRAAGSSPQITGILKDMGDTMKKNSASATAEEEASIKSFEELTAAKTKEVDALIASIEAKSAQIGESSVSLVQMKEDLTDTQE